MRINTLIVLLASAISMYGQAVITTIAGTGACGYTGNGGPATSATVCNPQAATADGLGNVYFYDAANFVVRKISTSGIITTIGGNGVQGTSGDGGPALNASLGIISQIAVGGGGTVALGDALAHKIRMVNLQTGVIQGYGTGNAVNAGDFGSFVSASFNQPKGLAMYEEIHPPVVGTGLFLSDPADNVIRRMDANGIMTTVVGPGTPGNLGDGGAGIFATVNNPASLTVFNGALYIADAGNHRIRKYDMTSTIITTVAGNGTVGYSGDGGSATAAQLSSPGQVT